MLGVEQTSNRAEQQSAIKLDTEMWPRPANMQLKPEVKELQCGSVRGAGQDRYQLKLNYVAGQWARHSEEGIKRQLALFEEFNLDWPQWMSFAAHYCRTLHHAAALVIHCTAMCCRQITPCDPSFVMGGIALAVQPTRKRPGGKRVYRQ